MSPRTHHLTRLALLAVFIACFILRAGDPPIADELDMVRPLTKWITEGPQRWGLWHSPFYSWIVALLGKLHGSFSLTITRSVGVLTTVLTAGLMYYVAHKIKPELAAWKLTLIVALGLMSPLMFGSAHLIDYDNTILLAATAVYFALIFAREKNSLRRPLRLSAEFGLALALCLVGKESTPLVYPIGLVVLWWKPLGPWRAIAYATLSGIFGVVLFLVLAWAWCAWYSLPLLSIFEWDYQCLIMRLGVGGAAPNLARSLWIRGSFVFWVGVPVFVFFAYKLPALIRRGGAIAAVSSIVVAVIFTYTFVLSQMTYQFPKYMVPVLPWISWLLLVAEKEVRQKHLVWWVGGICIWFALAPNPLNVIYERDTTSAFLSLAVTLAPILLGLALRRFRPSILQFSTLVALVSLGLCISYSKTLLFSNRALTFWYGDRAVHEIRPVVQSWRQKNPDGKLFVLAKDLTYATEDLGSFYINKDEMIGRAKTLCSGKKPFLLVTRIREDSSLLRAPELAVYRGCLKKIERGVDIVWGAAYSVQ